jgi:hypothetical protein
VPVPVLCESYTPEPCTIGGPAMEACMQGPPLMYCKVIRTGVQSAAQVIRVANTYYLME